MSVADESSPLHGKQEEDIVATNGRIQLKDDANTGEPFAAVLRRKGMEKVEASAKTNVSTRQQQEAAPAPDGSPEAKIEEESRTNAAVQADEKTDRADFVFHSFGAQFAKVLVDPDLGTIRVEKIASVMDIGTVMNHKTATNQIMGGILFGMGWPSWKKPNMTLITAASLRGTWRSI